MNSTRSLFALAKALEGVPILGVLQHTPAARAGIRHGDILLAVNGMRTKNFVDYVAAKALREDGMVVVLFRSGVDQTLELVYDEAPVTDPEAILAELASMHLPLGSDGGFDPTGTA